MSELVFGYDKELFQEALNERDRCRKAVESEDGSGAGPAAAAIILSEAAVETFVSEMLAVLEAQGSITPDQRASIENERKFWKRCKALYEELAGESLPKKSVYDDALVPLVKLRHCVVHRVADSRDSEAWPELIAPYQNKIEHLYEDGLHWTSQLLTYPTAKWATWAAYVSRQTLHAALPSETLREKFVAAFTTWVPEQPDTDVS